MNEAQRPPAGPPSHRTPWGLRLLVLAGLLLSGVMIARSQVGGDQLNLLARGWLLVERGELVPYGNPTSTGGVEPGAATSLLVALPLLVWHDHRAPAVSILICHLLAYLLLDRVFRQILGLRGRWLFAVLFWLNPWRLYHSAFLWNPNYLVLLGAVHTWSAYRLRRAPAWLPSLLHGLAIAVAAQLHPAALILILASVFLFLRGRLRPHWIGLVGGGILGSLTLVPWLLALLEGQELGLLEGGEGFPGRGLLLVFPLVKGLMYWLRYPSLFMAKEAVTFDFTAFEGPGARALEIGLAVLFGAAGVLGVGAAGFANLRMWRRLRRSERGGWHWRPWRRPPAPASDSARAWLRSYAGWTFVASLATFALSPTTPQSWQGLIVLHVAVVPVVLLLDALDRSRRHRRWVRGAVAAQAALSVAMGMLMAIASPHYRCGGRETLWLPLRHDSPMLHDLGIQETCPLPVEQPGGWWPDVLPPEG